MATVKKAKPSITQGQKVTWSSCGRGFEDQKTGVVKRYLDGLDDVRKFIPKNTPISKIMTRNYVSSHRRYLVIVEDQKLGTVFYTPRAATLEDQNLTPEQKIMAKEKATKAAKAEKKLTKTVTAAPKKTAKKTVAKKAAPAKSAAKTTKTAALKKTATAAKKSTVKRATKPKATTTTTAAVA